MLKLVMGYDRLSSYQIDNQFDWIMAQNIAKKVEQYKIYNFKMFIISEIFPQHSGDLI